MCPYSEKQLVTVKKTILPLIEQGKLDLKVILRQVSGMQGIALVF